MVVLSPSVGEEGYPATLERISGVIQGNGGEIKNVDQWGKRRLAYPIKRHLEGYYAVTKFAAEPTAIRAVEANLDLAEDVLRHLVIKLDGIKVNIPRVRTQMPEGAVPGAEATEAAPEAEATEAVTETEPPEAAAPEAEAATPEAPAEPAAVAPAAAAETDEN